MNTTADHSVLEAAHKARADAREKLEGATQALERGQRIASEAEAELAAARRVEEDATTAHASKLQHSITAGSQAMPPSLVIDTRPLQSAETRVAITTKVLQALTEQHAVAQTALRAAEAAVARAVDAVLNGEAEAIAADIERQHAALLRLSERLRGYLPSGAVGLGYSAPPIIARALALVPKQDSLHTPVHLLQSGAQPADFANFARRRAALIAGPSAEAAASDAAAA